MNTRHITQFIEAICGEDADRASRLMRELVRERPSSPIHEKQMAQMVFKIWKRSIGVGDHQGGVSENILIELIRRATDYDQASETIRTALEYLLLWTVVNRYFAENRLGRTWYHELRDDSRLMHHIWRAVEVQRGGLTTAYGLRMLEGMLTSVRNREGAAELFSAAGTANPAFSACPCLDQYVHTYMTSDYLHSVADKIDARRRALSEEWTFLKEPLVRSANGVLLLSCDPIYFSVYFPYWTSISEYLGENGIGIHFLLIGDTHEIAAYPEKAEAIQDAVSALRGRQGARAAANISLSQVSLPEYVVVPQTFYACARFVLAEEIGLRLDDDVVVIDTDMTLTQNPRAFMEGAKDAPFDKVFLAVGRGPRSLIPARRYMASLLAVPSKKSRMPFLRHAVDYMLAGLSMPLSWSLDQNALAYAVEQHVGEVGAGTVLPVGELGPPPFAQASGANLFQEAEERRLAKQ